mgnify:CR=1 FL=1
MKTVEAEQQLHYDSSFRLIGQRSLATIGSELVLQDISSTQIYLKIPLGHASKDRKVQVSIDYSTNQVSYCDDSITRRAS